MAAHDAPGVIRGPSGASTRAGMRRARPPELGMRSPEPGDDAGADQKAAQDPDMTLAASSGAPWAPRDPPAGTRRTAAYRRARPPSGAHGRLPDTGTRRTGGAPAAYPASMRILVTGGAGYVA